MTQAAGIVHRIRADGIAWRAVRDEVVILDTAQSLYFGLEHSGALLWPRLLDGATVADLVAALVAAMPVDSGRAEADVRAFLDELAAAGLLESRLAPVPGPCATRATGPA